MKTRAMGRAFDQAPRLATLIGLLMTCSFCLLFQVPPIQAAVSDKPNILVIWGDDVGYWNVSAYNQGMMGYETPNIGSLAKEGALFTDWRGGANQSHDP